MTPCSGFLNKLEAEFRFSQMCLEVLASIRSYIHQLRLIAKVLPHKRDKACELIRELAKLAVEVEELREKCHDENVKFEEVKP